MSKPPIHTQKQAPSKAIYSLIDGRQEPSPRHLLTKYRPYDEQEIYQLFEPNDTQLELALTAGDRAAKEMKQLSLTGRSELLLQLSKLIEKHKDHLIELEVEDTGRPITELKEYDIPMAIQSFERYAQLCKQLEEQTLTLGHQKAILRREPFGLCLGIGAWNYPLQIAAWKIAPALAAGNAMIFKPSELTSRTTLTLGKLALEAGLPTAALQVIVGGGDVATALIKSSRIRKVSLTGSTETGRKVARLAGQHLKPVTMELGGKSPLIIAAPFNLEMAADLACMANFYSTGQVCTNGTRVFVPENKIQDFLSLCYERFRKIKIGDPNMESTKMGPLISRAHKKQVLDYINSGLSEGAHLEEGGLLMAEASLDHGHYVKPVIFSQCTDSMRICREEIFGPVMSVLTYKNIDEVIQRANQLELGLAAGVVCDDSQKAESLARELDAGICWINTYNETPFGLPFGGTKSSGMGRENDLQGLLSYTQSKSILIQP